MYRFSQSFNNWTCNDDERVNIVSIESKGLDLDDLLCNASVSFEDWHGNYIRESWTIGDLDSKDYDQVIQLFTEYLQRG